MNKLKKERESKPNTIVNISLPKKTEQKVSTEQKKSLKIT